MSNIGLTLAIDRCDHLRDFTDGDIRAPGIDLTFVDIGSSESRYRFGTLLEFDVGEMPFGKYISLVSQDANRMVAIPVFPSRVFRHSAFYVRDGGAISSPAELAGKRIGIPEWAQTAVIYARGWMEHDVGLDLCAIEWFQAGVYEPGRPEKVALKLPDGLELTPTPDRSLDEMLRAGDLDAVISALPLPSFRNGEGVVRLIPDYRPAEEDYYRRTGIFPIMHVVAIRREVLDRHPWVAMNLYRAFEQAKDNSVARARNAGVSQFPIPWFNDSAARAQQLMGDMWPYGMEPNRATLEAFVQFGFEQGVCHRRLEIEELFPEGVRSFLLT